MRIDVYQAVTEHTPAGSRFLAKIIHNGDDMVIYWRGRTAESVIFMAQTWWDERVEKARTAKPRGRPKALDAGSDPGDVI